jgi:hypothetical protein
MHQRWDKLLFLHWPVAAEELRPLIPEPLEIDTHEGIAWLGVAPFTMSNLRPSFLPALPFVSRSHELNVRTYVHMDGIPGVWFFSLDASNPIAVLGARFAFSLPYFEALQSLTQSRDSIQFNSKRIHPGAPSAELKASWTLGDPLAEAKPGTLDFFLVERYCLYTSRGKHVYRARIFHRPWPLRRAALWDFSSTMAQSHRITIPPENPMLHAQAAPLDVEVWPLVRM